MEERKPEGRRDYSRTEAYASYTEFRKEQELREGLRKSTHKKGNKPVPMFGDKFRAGDNDKKRRNYVREFREGEDEIPREEATKNKKDKTDFERDK